MLFLMILGLVQHCFYFLVPSNTVNVISNFFFKFITFGKMWGLLHMASEMEGS